MPSLSGRRRHRFCFLERMRGVRHFTHLRAWQRCDAYKRAIYELTEMPCYQKDSWRREQLEKSAAGPPAHIAEGFGRFNPPEFAHYTTMAHGSLMESKNHLMDAVHKRYITKEVQDALIEQADAALAEVSGLLDYLKSAEARRNAMRVQQRREVRRGSRPLKANAEVENPGHPTPHPNVNPTPNVNRTRTRTEQGTGTRTQNPEPRTGSRRSLQQHN